MKINPKKEKRTFSKVMDTLLVALAIVLFWRGVWGLMDLYLFPKNLTISYMSSLAIGIVILYSTKRLMKYLI